MAIGIGKAYIRSHQLAQHIAQLFKRAIGKGDRRDNRSNRPSSENYWELRIERIVPCKRHHAYRVLVDNFADLWWHPSRRLSSRFHIDLRPGGQFSFRGADQQLIQAGTVLNTRLGWHISITDAIIDGHPGAPSMVVHWSIKTTPRDDPDRSPGNRSTYTVRVQHFSKSEYKRNISLGIERRLADSADRFVKLCEERAREYN